MKELLKHLQAENLGQLAFDRLEKAILSGEVEPGEKLSEAELARQMGISRGPLREAIGRLEGLGLVTRVANQRPHVTALTKEQLLELFVFREAVEGMAARYAALNAKPADIKRLHKLLDDHEKDPNIRSGTGYFQGTDNTDFHLQIAKASRNKRLSECLAGPIYSILRLYRRRLSKIPGRSCEALAEHRVILEAIEQSNPHLAEQKMRAHISAGSNNVHEFMNDPE